VLKRKLQTFRQLSPLEQKLLVQCLVYLPLLTVVLKVLGLRRTQSLLSRWTLQVSERWAVTDQDSQHNYCSMLEQALSTSRVVEAAGRYHQRWSKCLSQSLLLWWLLQCQGIPSQLRIGVLKHQRQIQAHAWVECQDQVLNDFEGTQADYVAFSQAISAPANTKAP
jgi:hypothetical protein